MAGYTATNWINKAVQYAQRFYMNTDGGNDKNMIPPFTEITLPVTFTLINTYAVSVTIASGSAGAFTLSMPAIESTQYSFSCTVTGAGYVYLLYKNSSGSTISTSSTVNSSTGSRTITTPVGTVAIQAAFEIATVGTSTFTNPQLELGSTSTAFTPKKMYTIVPAGGTVTAAGTPVNASNLNKIENALESMIGKDNTSIVETSSLKLSTDTRTTTIASSGGVITTITEKNGATTMRTTTLNYTSGNITSIVEVANGRTVTTTLGYSGGVINSITKAVV